MVRRLMAKTAAMVISASLSAPLLVLGIGAAPVYASCGAGNIAYYENINEGGSQLVQCELANIDDMSQIGCGLFCSWNDRISSLVANVTCQSVGSPNCHGIRLYKNAIPPGHLTDTHLTYGCSGWQRVDSMPSGWNDVISAAEWVSGWC